MGGKRWETLGEFAKVLKDGLLSGNGMKHRLHTMLTPAIQSEFFLMLYILV